MPFLKIRHLRAQTAFAFLKNMAPPGSNRLRLKNFQVLTHRIPLYGAPKLALAIQHVLVRPMATNDRPHAHHPTISSSFGPLCPPNHHPPPPPLEAHKTPSARLTRRKLECQKHAKFYIHEKASNALSHGPGGLETLCFEFLGHILGRSQTTASRLCVT